jgi:hypothetical protein
MQTPPDARPVPLRAEVSEPPVKLTVSVPVRLPVVVGVNDTTMLQLAPAVSVDPQVEVNGKLVTVGMDTLVRLLAPAVRTIVRALSPLLVPTAAEKNACDVGSSDADVEA